MARPGAWIVNVLSDFALIGFPGKSAYAASKFALRGFSESLYGELAGTGVGLSVVYPGAVATNLIRAGRAQDAEKQAIEARFLDDGMTPEYVARKILRAVRKRRFRIRIGRETYLFDWLVRLAPVGFYKMLARFRHRIPFL